MNILERMVAKIAGMPGEVILRADLVEFGSQSQVTRAIRKLIADGVMVRISNGIYAKAKYSRFADYPILRVTFAEVGWEALQRLGIEVKLGRAAQANLDGRSTQVPVRIIFNTGLKSVRRKIAFKKQQIFLENDLKRGIYPDPFEKKGK